MFSLSAALVLAAVAGASTPPAAPARQKQAGPPNFVVILADDLGYGDPGCYNKASKIPTPHIDRLATRGMRFTDAHTPASLCTPTRYGVLTGRYPWRSALKRGVLDGYSAALIEPGRMTLASLLRGHGYYTACIGKWHLGLGPAGRTDYARALKPGPNAVGFDFFYGIAASLDMPPYVFIENEQVTEAPTASVAASEPRRKGGKGFWRAGAGAPGFKHEEVMERLTEKAVDLVRKQSAAKPFFLYLPLTAPHMPWVPPAKFVGTSRAGPYGDFVAQVDDTVGRVMKALEDAGLAENTLLVVTSDNGAYWFPEDIQKWGHRANDDLHGQKADIWEGGHRVPFIVRWPGKVRAGSTCTETVSLTDLLATAAALVGAPLPADAGEDSFDLSPALLGRKLERPLREATVLQAGDGTLAIRQGPWRLAPALGSHGFSTPTNVVARPGEAQGELYDLDLDPQERTNLWLREPEVVRRLTALLERYRAEGRTRPK